MNLVRNGKVVHRDTCRYAASAVEWEWADNQPKERVLAVIITMGYRMCLHCHPLGGEMKHG